MASLASLRRLLLEKQFYTSQKKMPKFHCFNYSDEKSPPQTKKSKKVERNLKTTTSSLDEIEEPTNCCMSGCANCVWLQYAEKVSQIMTENDKDVQKIILEKIQDPNMRAFLQMELRCRNLIKK
ncbi:uncharacterized protein LOC117171379 [Belonocnema kinseyi]|uniref:uncharacterized protein LOC117171379 n=1 Tax=Belonocnema kinseyi TaxID=2817044 RepID=UPI00143CC354|nr:uncharacterized protein LOC117171379 [Belonocnema kinseyi]